MTLAELMADYTPDATYEGWVTNDDWVLAVGENLTDTDPDDFLVVEMGVDGLDAQLNPITQDKTYIRAGQSTQKTGTQRTFKPTGDLYVGDEFQDLCFSHAIKFGKGNAVVRPYVYFNILNGKGESGQVSIIVNSDASGSAGESTTFDVDLKKIGADPAEYTYTASGDE